MVTLVGTQENFLKALQELMELDFDAIEAYQAAIDRLDNQAYIGQLESFMKDHMRHTRDLKDLIIKAGGTPPEGTSAKSYLTKGKVVLGSLIGDKVLLMAMKTNEDDTNTAYEKLNSHPHKTQESSEILKIGLEDEKRHRKWIEDTISKMS